MELLIWKLFRRSLRGGTALNRADFTIAEPNFSFSGVHVCVCVCGIVRYVGPVPIQSRRWNVTFDKIIFKLHFGKFSRRALRAFSWNFKRSCVIIPRTSLLWMCAVTGTLDSTCVTGFFKTYSSGICKIGTCYDSIVLKWNFGFRRWFSLIETFLENVHSWIEITVQKLGQLLVWIRHEAYT